MWVEAQWPVVTDPVIVDRVGGIVARLLQAMDAPAYNWRVRVIANPVPNAFALPNGYIYVHLGLLQNMPGDGPISDDELAFAYRNPARKGRLLVFAVDEHGHVYWYHPGWSDAGQNPTAVPISAEPGLHELPAAVLHKFDGERIMIHALFTDRELSVRQIEAAVASAERAHSPSASVPLSIPGAIDIVQPLRVVR